MLQAKRPNIVDQQKGMVLRAMSRAIYVIVVLSLWFGGETTAERAGMVPISLLTLHPVRYE